MQSIFDSERGATLVYVALSSFVLLLFLGLATDAGWMVWVRTQGQKRVDAAALAAAQALVDQTPTIRATKAATLADTFSGQNLVVDSSTNPANTVTPMHFDLTTGALTELGSDWSPGFDGANCDAVKVTTVIPTPVFFSGVRGFISGAAEANSADINVSAVAHLPCPGLLVTAVAALAPIALRQCNFSIADCGGPNKVSFQSSGGGNSVVFTTFNLPANDANCRAIADGAPYPSGLVPEVKVGDLDPTHQLNLIDSSQLAVGGALNSCLVSMQTHYTGCNCEDPACTAVVPIIECSGSKVVGFATVCFTGFNSTVNPTYVRGSLQCSEHPSGAGGASGACLGTYARTPVLVQ